MIQLILLILGQNRAFARYASFQLLWSVRLKLGDKGNHLEMCLLKVYVQKGNTGRELVAQEIALVNKISKNIKLVNLDFEEIIFENADILSIDTLNSVLLLKKQEE